MNAPCRVCETPLPDKPVFSLDNVPVRAQYFPSKEELTSDKGVELNVFACVGCGHVQLASEPIVYDQGLTSTTAFSPQMLAYRQQQMKTFVERFDLVGKRVLDVGCGDGHLLQILAEVGAEPIGVDASHKALAIARQHGFTVHYGYLERNHVIESAPFDAFVSTDVIEHVPNIKSFLQGLWGNLRDGAIGLLETPSFEKVLENNRFVDFIIDHISYFTCDTLRLSFELSGFEVLSIERNRDNENLTALVKKRPAPSLESLVNHQEHLKESFTRFVAEQVAAGRRVALWGASLQTLTLSSILPLTDIAYVLDSAPYKQGLYVPISHLPIVGPEVLETDPVEVIIVNAPRYETEILDRIQNQIQFSGMIASLTSGEIQIIQSS